jgi:hypothetical protein
MSRTRPIAKVDLLQNPRVPRALCGSHKKSPQKPPQFKAFNSGTTNFPSFRITLPSNRISPPP